MIFSRNFVLPTWPISSFLAGSAHPVENKLCDDPDPKQDLQSTNRVFFFLILHILSQTRGHIRGNLCLMCRLCLRCLLCVSTLCDVTHHKGLGVPVGDNPNPNPKTEEHKLQHMRIIWSDIRRFRSRFNSWRGKKCGVRCQVYLWEIVEILLLPQSWGTAVAPKDDKSMHIKFASQCYKMAAAGRKQMYDSVTLGLSMIIISLRLLKLALAGSTRPFGDDI